MVAYNFKPNTFYIREFEVRPTTGIYVTFDIDTYPTMTIASTVATIMFVSFNSKRVIGYTRIKPILVSLSFLNKIKKNHFLSYLLISVANNNSEIRKQLISFQERETN